MTDAILIAVALAIFGATWYAFIESLLTIGCADESDSEPPTEVRVLHGGLPPQASAEVSAETTRLLSANLVPSTARRTRLRTFSQGVDAGWE